MNKFLNTLGSIVILLAIGCALGMKYSEKTQTCPVIEIEIEVPREDCSILDIPIETRDLYYEKYYLPSK